MAIEVMQAFNFLNTKFTSFDVENDDDGDAIGLEDFGDEA